MFTEEKPIMPQVEALFEERKQRILSTSSDFDKTANLYYVSEKGNDENDGKTSQTPWRTIQKVSTHPLEKGDVVLFCRGEIFRGPLYAKEGVTYSAYGEGEKPRLYTSFRNAANPSYWTLLEGTDNIYVYAYETVDIGVAVFNEGEAYSYKEVPSYVDGVYYVREKGMRFHTPRKKETPFDVTKHIAHDLGIFCDCRSVMRTTSQGYQVPDPDNADVYGTLYMRCDKGNPGEIFSSIELSPRFNGIYAANGVTVDNLCIKYAGCHGVGEHNIKNLTVKNCCFEFIGGAMQLYHDNGTAVRFGNGVEVYITCENFTVKNCYFHQIYDAAISHQFRGVARMRNILYKDNLINKSFYGIEFFNCNPVKNVRIENNMIFHSGYGYCATRPDTNLSAAIKGWGSNCYYGAEKDILVKNNIFLKGIHALIDGCFEYPKRQFTLDGNVYLYEKEQPVLNLAVSYSIYCFKSGEDAPLFLQDERGKFYKI